MNIGDKIYKYLSFNGFAEYIVLAVIKREKATMYEVECQACQHGEKCRLIVSELKGKKTFKYCSMLNDDEHHEQYYWHDDDIYYLNLNEARLAKYDECVVAKRKNIEKHKNIVKRLENELDDLLQHRDNLSQTKGGKE